MKNRKVIVLGKTGVVVKWEPLSSGMCDAFVIFKDGSECWFSSTELRPADDLGPLPSRADARAAAEAETIRSLRAIRAQHVADFNKPWPGLEHGKALFGQMLDGAIGDLEKKFDSTDVEVEKRSDAILDKLGAFARSEIVRTGTAFTTYEEHGDDVCAALERRCRAWYASLSDAERIEAFKKDG